LSARPQVVFQHIPAHLVAKGKGRKLNFGVMTKEEKLEQQLKQADERIAKTNAEKLKIHQAIQVVKS